jgi:hypothetical protein
MQLVVVGVAIQHDFPIHHTFLRGGDSGCRGLSSKVTRLAISMSLRNKSLTNEPLAKLPTRKRGKLHMTPDKSFFERDRAGSSIFGKLPRYFFGFIKIRA